MKFHLFLSKKRSNTNGLVPVYAKITIEGRIYERSSGVFILPQFWNADFKRIKNGVAGSSEANQKINEFETKLNQLQEKNASIEIIDKALTMESQSSKPVLTLLNVIEEYISRQAKLIDLPQGISYETYKTYTYKEKNIKNYLTEIKKLDMPIANFGYAEAEKFKLYCYEQKFGTAYINRHIKFLRTIMRFAHYEYKVEQSNFMLMKLKEPAAKPITYLTELELEKIQKHVFLSSLTQKAADLFLLQCFTGMAYCDVITLSEQNIITHGKSEFIAYNRRKTSVRGLLPLLPQVKVILKRYSGKAPELCNQLYNRVLKEIAAVCEIQKHITTHIGRKTFACLLVSKGASMEATTKMLAKTNVQETAKVYAEVQWKRILDEMPKFG